LNLVNVQFRVTCAADDPQAPARVMGVFAARSLLPLRFFAERTVIGTVEIDIMLDLEDGDCSNPEHLARVISRFPTVISVLLLINGRPRTFGLVPADSPAAPVFL
jgi:hypothetical protein